MDKLGTQNTRDHNNRPLAFALARLGKDAIQRGGALRTEATDLTGGKNAKKKQAESRARHAPVDVYSLDEESFD